MRPGPFTRVGIALEPLQYCPPCIPIVTQHHEYGIAVRLCRLVHRLRRLPHESREILFTPGERLARFIARTGGYGEASRRSVNLPRDASLVAERPTQISTQLCE